MRSNPVLGSIIAILTFPGIIVHELAHKLLCGLTHVTVHKVCYFRLGNPSGYVIHEQPGSYGKALLIDTAPFLINTIIAIILYSIAVTIPQSSLTYILYWLGISIAMHSFPSSGDADILWNQSKSSWRKNPLALLGFPIVGLIKLAALLSRVWFDLLYAIALLVLVAFLLRGELPFHL
ncbi:MAG: hypothetical protein FJ008_07410 [Chloroflexi bacterium]|nr:hypothetical protein [Chloroflexota bacterium]MBM3173683.1 hypothetical protein [Chloroflexota bacterium]MBM3175616.1 hypothetical protein [Chloroflexota bacterium]MBM4449752.1 hypothetical protein [Chloroflexota bacterium]